MAAAAPIDQLLKQALEGIAARGLATMTTQGPLLSLVALVAGGPVRGSWWSHPRGQEIFRVAGAVDDHPDVLACKLVAGKVTFVDRALWPALLALATDPGRTVALLAALDPAARQLLERVELSGELNLDQVARPGTPERRVLQPATKTLEAAMLLLSRSEHTERGHHATVLTSWERWSRDGGLRKQALPKPEEARATIERACEGEPCPLLAAPPSPGKTRPTTPAASARRRRR